LSITNNKISNMYKSAETTNQTYVYGIWLNTAVLYPVTITGNEIHDLVYTGSRVNDTPLNWSSGITCGSQGVGSVIANNIIYNIEGLNGQSANVQGIALVSTGAAKIDVNNNNIYNLTSNVTRKLGQYATGVAGIVTHTTGAVTPTFNVYNNMIRLGFDRSGNALTNALLMAGIRDSVMSTGSAKANYYNNTIYIGGTGVATNDTVPTFGLCFATGTSVVRELKNNLIVNVRSNASTGSGHYAIATGGSATALANITSDYNDFIASGTGGVLGRFTSKTDAVDLAAIQSYTAGDANSKNVAPAFIDPTAVTPNLHLDQYNSINGNLNFATSITLTDNDIDGDARKGSNRTFGADEYKGIVDAVQPLNTGNVFVYSLGRNIVIKGLTKGEFVTIYNVNGQQIKQITANENQTSLSLNSGVYLIKTAHQVIKVVIW